MISAIVLAAGMSERTGRANKLLLPCNGEALVTHVVRQVCHAEADEVIVVTGYEAVSVAAVLAALPVRLIHNPRFAQGITSSVQAGVRAASREATGLMICLGDLPGLTATQLLVLTSRFKQALPLDARLIVRAMHDGEPGHPVIFAGTYREEMLACRAPHGCADIISCNETHLVAVPLAASTADIDTLADYERLLGPERGSKVVFSAP